ncbi:MAG: hypothetical protein ABSC77_09540 [Terracidiphilus sp.]|jgi:hypothetical protein
MSIEKLFIYFLGGGERTIPQDFQECDLDGAGDLGLTSRKQTYKEQLCISYKIFYMAA